MPLNLKALARELDDLREKAEEDPSVVLDDEDLARVHDLENLAGYLGGDLHVAANHGVTLLDKSEAKRAVLDEIEIPDVLRAHVDFEGLADDLLVDWTTIEFDGEDYYTRDA
jgi:hypothetical protein